MKNIISHLFILGIVCSAHAQLITIPINISLSLQDLLSQRQYAEINRYNGLLLAQEGINAGNIRNVTSVFNDQLQELISFNPLYKAQEFSLRKFISNSTFNSVSGYNSFGYIRKKYPISGLHANDIYRNTVIQLRYRRKFNKEKNKVRDYLNFTNPIPEGERVLLLLNVLENVINITLENETY